MKRLLLLLALLGAALANGDATYDDFVECDKACCTSNAGSWDEEYEWCDIDTTADGYDDYETCYGQCWEDSYGSSGASYQATGCCAPALVLLGLVGFVMIRR